MNQYVRMQEDVEAIFGLFDREVRISERETEKGFEEVLRLRRLFGQKYLEDELILTVEMLQQ
jgi:hypothetical protein